MKLDATTPIDETTLAKLKSLYPKGKEKIKSVKGLNYAYNLTHLYLPNQEITDISPLSNLYQLDFLALDGNQIRNACPIANLPYLRQLLISNNQIEDIGCFSRLTTLTDLLISKNKIQSIAPLAKLNIGWLDISNNPITDLSSTKSMNYLSHLFVDQTALNENSVALLQQLDRSGVGVNRASAASSTNSGIAVLIDTERVWFDHAASLEAGTTLVQFRPLFEKLGFTIQWDDATRTIQAEKQGTRITLQVDSPNGSLNGQPYELTVAPKIIEGSVFVPIRFVGEASNYVVTWESKNKTINLVPERAIESPDHKIKLTLNGKWLRKIAQASTDYQIYTENGNNAIFTTAEPKDYLVKKDIKTLQDYTTAIYKMIDDQKASGLSETKIPPINGMEARRMSYSIKGTNGINYAVIQTFIEGKHDFFRVILTGVDLTNSEAAKDYEKSLRTFKEVTTLAEQSQAKFGALKPVDRMLEAARYYRNFGFFEKDRALSSQDFDNKFLAQYNKLTTWNPFDSSKYYDPYAELYLLEQDLDHVWFEDLELVVARGKNVYVDTLQAWSWISRGAFRPTAITETWESDKGPVTITFNLNGQKKVIHPQYYGDYLDVNILKEINEMIKGTGYQFVAVQVDQEIFISVLKAEEKLKLQQERYLDFVDF
ncbi:stalk domain-containing protein [Paenibacillus roseipurpureus]|uniref:Stalk domain-containing protein n=1 Tax=Paenibacillus roseopurpureus TaxID=2918901 RepID=A0AA96LQ05_9BACL|nr:stalk domain-containing protein [Paenibacillus sp. MBLB1832]WNR45166.1 stalk domain-containing protein [Paenibacillus sp. MBLB1832]